jgi:hypothetical protein
MNRRQISFLLVGALGLGGLQGCGSTANSRSGYLAKSPCASCGYPSPQPPRFTPAPAPVFPGPNPPPGVVAPPGGGIQQNSYIPPPGLPSQPAPAAVAPSVSLEAPEPVEPAPARPMPNDSRPPQETTRPYPPQTPEPPKAPFMPPARDDGVASPALPVDIPQFAVAKPDVAGGQEPFADGVNWLKSHGYRSVLHILAPGEDDSAARRSFEQSGLRYLKLEVSARTLSKEVVDQFNHLVADPNNLPLFVYDKDSSLAGGLWYLHFRLVEKETDAKAREDAARLGFQQNANEPHKTMWIAVQNYLSNVKP